MTWPGNDRLRLQTEQHFGDRVSKRYVDRPRSLDALFLAAVHAEPRREAIVADGERLSYADLDARVDRAALGLRALGIRVGDRVALLLGNGATFVILLLACARIGAIAVPLGTRQREPELRYALNDCGAAVVFAEADFAANLPAVDAVPELRQRIVIDAGEPLEAFAAMSENAHRPFLSVPVSEEATAVILYTSGTTGRPKGAMLTHLGIVHSALNFVHCLGLTPDDRAVLTVPASHVTGLIALIATMLHAHGTTILMRAFRARDFLALAAAERMTYTLMVPAQYGLCLIDPTFDDVDLSAWRMGGFGGAPMPEATIARLGERLPGLVLVNAYGATETTSPTSIMPPGLNDSHRDSVGKVVPGGTVRIVDEAGRDVPPGTPGEIWIAGPMVVPGYWNRPDVTHSEFVDGFWRSGDVGSLDAEGFLRLFDRKKDMVNRAGFKIYSAEVENVLSHCPGVIESAIVGVPDPILGERVKAFVHGAPGALTVDGVRSFCAARLSDYKVPEFIELLDEPLPRNANGKLQKAVLRARP